MNDMTKGSPLRILVTFSLPMLVSMIFQQMYSVVDTIVAGRFISANALAAVGASYPITTLFIAFATGASIGCSVVVSQLFGRRDYAGVKTATCTATLSILALSLVLTVIGLLAADPLLRLIETPAKIFTATSMYLKVYLLGLVFLFLYNTATALFQGLGDSQTPLYFLIFSSVLNIALDLFLVIRCGWGVLGVAWATVIAQGVASLLAIATLVRRVLKLESDGPVRRFDPGMLPVMVRIAVPSVCQQSFVSVGVFLVQGLINSFGEITIAAFAAALKVNTFACMTMNTLPTALTSFASQNIGAGKLDRVYRGLKISIIFALVIEVLANLVLLVWGGDIIGLFSTDYDRQAIVAQGMQFLRVCAPFYCLIAVKNCCDSVLRGGGAMGQFMATTFADLFLRVIIAYVLVRAVGMGYAGVCWSYPIGWVLGTALSVVFFKTGRWKLAKV